MQYSNPQIPEGINTSKEHPLKEFFILSVGVIGAILVTLLLLIVTVDFFADKIPFKWEKSIPVHKLIAGNSEPEIPQYLQDVSNRVIDAIDLPEDMDIQVHYVNQDVVNAFATLGGHIFLYRGLLEKLQSEDELAMVIAHEVAHIKHRHPIMGASHGLIVSLFISFLTGSSGDDFASLLVDTSGVVAVMHFSRDFEYESDEEAIAVLKSLYGHTQGAVQLFNIFKQQVGDYQSFEFLSTHPLTDKRIERVESLSAGAMSRGSLTPLPAHFTSWLENQRKLPLEKAENHKGTSKNALFSR